MASFTPLVFNELNLLLTKGGIIPFTNINLCVRGNLTKTCQQ